MADYHGDIMYRTGRVYESRDDVNYVVAIILLLLFGSIGIHRFYMNDNRIAFMYFVPFAASCFIGVMLLDFTLLLWYSAIAGVFLLGELIFFIYKLTR